jgi:DNA-binding XRE family transcriptional regulator
MNGRDNKFRAARKASDMSQSEAASACGIADPTYRIRERSPLSFRINELRGLYSSLSETAKPVLLDAINEAIEDGD